MRTYLTESRVVLELPRLLFSAPRWLLGRAQRGDGGPVLVLPGFGASDASTALLRAYLKTAGYEPHPWGLGVNRGDARAVLADVVARARRITDAAGVPTLRLVGWSHGGVVARELARAQPDLVSHVITMGTPVVGGAKYTAVRQTYIERGVDLDAIEAAIDRRERENPLAVPVTAIYTKNDTIVHWRACIDPHNADVDHIEVGTTHMGLGFSPEVFEVIGRVFAR